jgi:hypothetical protein
MAGVVVKAAVKIRPAAAARRLVVIEGTVGAAPADEYA